MSLFSSPTVQIPKLSSGKFRFTRLIGDNTLRFTGLSLALIMQPTLRELMREAL